MLVHGECGTVGNSRPLSLCGTDTHYSLDNTTQYDDAPANNYGSSDSGGVSHRLVWESASGKIVLGVVAQVDDLVSSDCSSHQSTPWQVLYTIHPLVGVGATKDEGICNDHVKQEPENILIVLSAFQADMVVPT